MKFSITNYYIPRASDSFYITKTSIALQGRPRRLGKQNSELLSSIMPVEIADYSRQNHFYNALLSNLGIDQMGNGEILVALKLKHLAPSSAPDHPDLPLSEKETTPQSNIKYAENSSTEIIRRLEHQVSLRKVGTL